MGTLFFKLNMPYGIKKNDSNEWFAINKDYEPISKAIAYKGLTEAFVNKHIATSTCIYRNADTKEIYLVLFYNDATHPQKTPENWHNYITVLNSFCKLTALYKPNVK